MVKRKRIYAKKRKHVAKKKKLPPLPELKHRTGGINAAFGELGATAHSYDTHNCLPIQGWENDERTGRCIYLKKIEVNIHGHFGVRTGALEWRPGATNNGNLQYRLTNYSPPRQERPLSIIMVLDTDYEGGIPTWTNILNTGAAPPTWTKENILHMKQYFTGRFKILKQWNHVGRIVRGATGGGPGIEDEWSVIPYFKKMTHTFPGNGLKMTFAADVTNTVKNRIFMYAVSDDVLSVVNNHHCYWMDGRFSYYNPN